MHEKDVNSDADHGLVMCVTSGRQNVDEVVQTVATHRFKVPFLFFTHARTLSLSLSVSPTLFI